MPDKCDLSASIVFAPTIYATVIMVDGLHSFYNIINDLDTGFVY